jgi:hypothetical protein
MEWSNLLRTRPTGHLMGTNGGVLWVCEAGVRRAVYHLVDRFTSEYGRAVDGVLKQYAQS